MKLRSTAVIAFYTQPYQPYPNKKYILIIYKQINMKFMQSVGRGLRSFGRTVGNIAGAVKTIADSAPVRTIASAIGSAGSRLLPLAAPLVAGMPELAPVYAGAQKLAAGLKSGATLNAVDRLAGKAQNVGNRIASAGASFT
jgi:hypothetical protein